MVAFGQVAFDLKALKIIDSGIVSLISAKKSSSMDEKRFATNVNNLFSYIAIAFGTRFHRLLSVIVVPRFSIPSNISIVLNTDLVRRFRGTFSFKFIILLLIGVSFIA